MTHSTLNKAAQPLLLSAQQLLDVSQGAHEGGSFELPLEVGRQAFEALDAWDDAVLQTLGTERNRYANNLQNKDLEPALLATEGVAVAVWLAVDFPRAMFDNDDNATQSLTVTWQAGHAAALTGALAAHPEAQAPSNERPRAPKP